MVLIPREEYIKLKALESESHSKAQLEKLDNANNLEGNGDMPTTLDSDKLRYQQALLEENQSLAKNNNKTVSLDEIAEPRISNSGSGVSSVSKTNSEPENVPWYYLGQG